MITLNSKRLAAGDKVQFRSGGLATVARLEQRNDSGLPVKIWFQGFEAPSHYAANGLALPNRGVSPHDVTDIIKTGPDFSTMAPGTQVNVRSSYGSSQMAMYFVAMTGDKALLSDSYSNGVFGNVQPCSVDRVTTA